MSVTDAQDLQSNDLVFGENTQIDLSGHSRSKHGVASLAYVPNIHVSFLSDACEDVDGRDEPGHDEPLILIQPDLLHARCGSLP
ncbi:MAG: hypothetical protein J0H51_12150 [Rhizobiales bacterium]|nr:hypothetical protein [Hyphomicrobiales bacterium]